MLSVHDYAPVATLPRSLPEVRDSPLRAVEDLLRRVRRHWKAILAAYVLVLGGAMLLVAQSVPRYTADVQVLIDARKVGLTALNPLEGSLAFDTGAIDSQVQLIQSDAIAHGVVMRLGLQADPAFLDPPRSAAGRLVRRVLERLRGPAPPVMALPEPARVALAARLLSAALDVKRVGRTYVLVLSVTLPDPQRAASVAGAFADVYLADQLESKFDAARRATVWLDERLRDIRARAIAADDAVQRYRAENNLTFAAGQLVSEQALAQISQQLSLARGTLADAEARFARLDRLVADREVSGAVTEGLNNPVVADLRSKYLAATKRLAELEQRLAPGHERIAETKAEIAQYETLIVSELDRARDGARSDLEIARDRVKRLEAEASSQVAGTAVDNKALAKLNSLTQEATTYNTLYAAYLQRYQETAQQESFPVGDARVISPPVVPSAPSSPDVLRAGLAGLLLATLAAALAVALLDFRDRGYRTREQVRDDLGLPLLSYLPDLPYRRRRFRRAPPAGASVLDVTLTQPLSRYTEGIRAIQIAAERRRQPGRPLVVGIVSALPDEGKTSVSKNLASLMARAGGRVLLVDGDARNPSLTRWFGAHPRTLDRRTLADLGLDLAALSGAEGAGPGAGDAGRVRGGEADRPVAADVSAVGAGGAGPAAASGPIAGDGADRLAGVEPHSGLAFVGAPGAGTGAPDFGRSLSRVVDAARPAFATVVIDFPPLAYIHDAVAHAAEVDVFILVVEWGMTPRRTIRDVLAQASDIGTRLEGAVLNKCSLKTLSLYGASAGDYLLTRKAAAYYEAAP